MRFFDAIAGEAKSLLGTGDSRICIAVIDSPVDLCHPCFSGSKVDIVECFSLENERVGSSRLRHGTQVASIIFGQPGSSVAGLAPACSGIILPIFSSYKSEDHLTCTQLDLARAILIAVEKGANIINISGGQLSDSSEPDPALSQAIETCQNKNILIVAAAGNDSCDCLHIPAAASSVLAVGATDDTGFPLSSSNWGDAYASNALLAPGTNIPAAVPEGIKSGNGTSYATPVVTSICALLASRQIQAGNTPDLRQIRDALLFNSDVCPTNQSQDCRRWLSGRINVARTYNYLVSGGHIMANTELGSEVSTAELMNSAEFSNASLSHGPEPKISRPAGNEAAFAQRTQSQIMLSDCGCGGSGKCSCGGGGKCTCHEAESKGVTLVYALGKIGYDFGTEARRDSFIQAMPTEKNNPFVVGDWLDYVDANQYEATGVIWTLNADATPIYAVQPAGPFAEVGYARLREFLRGQVEDGVELVSIPGVMGGRVRLQSGQIVPMIVPAIRGMFSWATQPLVVSILGVEPEAGDARQRWAAQAQGLSDFLNRVYYDLRNLGITGEERALNFAATNAFQISDVISFTTRAELDLDTVNVKKSPICRPDSDCYDVEISFFNPDNTNVAARVFRFTVDVSDIIPVTVGQVRSWTRRGV